MSNLAKFARSELQRAGLFDKDSDYEGMLGDGVMRLIETFAAEGHSGCSMAMTIALFKKVANFEPLTPLTGDDDEWNDVSECGGGDIKYQNNRCSHIFKDANGSVYDIKGKVFRKPSGYCFTSCDSRTEVTFPYVPSIEYVDVFENEKEDDNRNYREVKNES